MSYLAGYLILTGFWVVSIALTIKTVKKTLITKSVDLVEVSNNNVEPIDFSDNKSKMKLGHNTLTMFYKAQNETNTEISFDLGMEASMMLEEYIVKYGE